MDYFFEVIKSQKIEIVKKNRNQRNSMNSYISTKISNKIARITFYNEKKNSFTSEQLTTLAETINKLSNDSEITSIILESEGNSVFCSGASFDELLQIENQTQGKKFFSGFAQVILSMRNCSKIIVGYITGKVVGGGVGLVAACDYAIATKNASIKLSEIAIGIGPFVIEPVVSKKIGKAAMAELTLNPTEWKDANWALQKGLFAKVFEDDEAAENFLLQYTQNLSSYNPEALTNIKQVIWENTEHWNELLEKRAEISGKLVLSDFTKNTLKQFKNS